MLAPDLAQHLIEAMPYGVALVTRGRYVHVNTAWADLLMWDGRKSSLEEQALGPITADVEMNHSLTPGFLFDSRDDSGFGIRFGRLVPVDLFIHSELVDFGCQRRTRRCSICRPLLLGNFIFRVVL